MSELIDVDKINLRALDKHIKVLSKELDISGLESLAIRIGMDKKEKAMISSFDYISLKESAGIYIFYIHFKQTQCVVDFIDQWTEYKQANKGDKISGINKRNVKDLHINRRSQQGNLNYVLYIGKAEAKLGKRLMEHIEFQKGVFGLTLKGFSNWEDYEIMCECYVFKENIDLDDSTKQVLLLLIEKALHKKIKPLIGTSK